jgi:hypothetical protein
MKFKILLIVLFFYCNKLYCQDNFIACTKNNFVFANIDNLIQISYNGKYDNLFLKSNNGEMDYINDFSYYWRPYFAKNNDSILLYKVLNRDTILVDIYYFSIYDIPLPIFKLWDKSGGNFPKDKLLKIVQPNYNSVKAEIDDKYFTAYLDGIGLRLTGFSFIIVRNDSIIYFNKNNIFKFCDEDSGYSAQRRPPIPQ